MAAVGRVAIFCLLRACAFRGCLLEPLASSVRTCYRRPNPRIRLAIRGNDVLHSENTTAPWFAALQAGDANKQTHKTTVHNDFHSERFGGGLQLRGFPCRLFLLPFDSISIFVIGSVGSSAAPYQCVLGTRPFLLFFFRRRKFYRRLFARNSTRRLGSRGLT